MRVRTTFTLGALLAACFVAPAAQAEWILTPYGGIVFGGDLGIEGNDNLDLNRGKRVYGVGLGYMGNSALGFEVDLGYSPDFFGGDASIVPDNNLTTLMSNLVLNAPIGQSGRVYVSAGGGLMKSRVNDTDDLFDVSRNDFGVNAGVGAILPLGERFGLRGDVRYFRSLQDHEREGPFDVGLSDFRFWRGTVGLSFRW